MCSQSPRGLSLVTARSLCPFYHYSTICRYTHIFPFPYVSFTQSKNRTANSLLVGKVGVQYWTESFCICQLIASSFLFTATHQHRVYRCCTNLSVNRLLLSEVAHEQAGLLTRTNHLKTKNVNSSSLIMAD